MPIQPSSGTERFKLIHKHIGEIKAGDDAGALKIFTLDGNTGTPFEQAMPMALSTGDVSPLDNSAMLADVALVKDAAARVLAHRTGAFLAGEPGGKLETEYKESILKPARYFGIEPADLAHEMNKSDATKISAEDVHFSMQHKLLDCYKALLTYAKRAGTVKQESMTHLYADIADQYALMDRLHAPGCKPGAKEALANEAAAFQDEMKPYILQALAKKTAILTRSIRRKPSTWHAGIDDLSAMLIIAAEHCDDETAFKTTRDTILRSPAIARELIESAVSSVSMKSRELDRQGLRIMKALYPDDFSGEMSMSDFFAVASAKNEMLMRQR